jgi:hydroxymethylpyrimidine kinase/phosphomethylpyrimidine kinase/thiamine-phosphate diphosphorylase
MPWLPQGVHNLRWWKHMAGAPVVAIGGILLPDQVRLAASCGADGVCVVRGLGLDPRERVPALQVAFNVGAAEAQDLVCPDMPRPAL